MQHDILFFLYGKDPLQKRYPSITEAKSGSDDYQTFNWFWKIPNSGKRVVLIDGVTIHPAQIAGITLRNVLKLRSDKVVPVDVSAVRNILSFSKLMAQRARDAGRVFLIESYPTGTIYATKYATEFAGWGSLNTLLKITSLSKNATELREYRAKIIKAMFVQVSKYQAVATAILQQLENVNPAAEKIIGGGLMGSAVLHHTLNKREWINPGTMRAEGYYVSISPFSPVNGTDLCLGNYSPKYDLTSRTHAKRRAAIMSEFAKHEALRRYTNHEVIEGCGLSTALALLSNMGDEQFKSTLASVVQEIVA